MRSPSLWFARLAVSAVFLMNISCAFDFLLRPGRYTPGFEVSGAAGRAIVQGFGLLFLMWNATYPPVIIQPARQKTLFIVILVQQLIGVTGESWLYFRLPAEYTALRATGLRFIIFDGLGLLLIAVAYGFLHLRRSAPKEATPS